MSNDIYIQDCHGFDDPNTYDRSVTFIDGNFQYTVLVEFRKAKYICKVTKKSMPKTVAETILELD